MISLENEKFLTKKLPSIVVLSLMYVFLGVFAENKIVNPFSNADYISNIELIVPVLGSIIFGPIIGGGVGIIGFILLQISYLALNQDSIPFGLLFIAQGIGYFVSFWLLGKISEDRKPQSSIIKLISNPHFWFRLIMDILATIAGLALIYPLAVYLFLLLIGSTELVNDNFYFHIFSSNLILSIFVFPIMLIFYEIIQILRLKREKKLDDKHKNIKVNVTQEGSGIIEEAYFDKHAFCIGQWTPVHIKFRHKWKAPRSYEIEAVSTSRIYPHIEQSAVLNENETLTHVIYVLPLKQDFVDILVRFVPSHTKKFGEEIKVQTVARLKSPTYIKRDVLFVSVILLSETFVFLFLFSILWNQVNLIVSYFIFEQGSRLPTVAISWTPLIIISIIELIIFLPFLGLMYLLQKEKIGSIEEKDLAFAHDISSHNYATSFDKQQSRLFTLKKVGFGVLSIFSFSSLIIITNRLWEITQPSTNSEPLPKNGFMLYLVLAAIIGIVTIKVNKNGFELIFQSVRAEISEGSHILSIKPIKQFQIYKPNQMQITIKNNTKLQGLRFVFKGTDTISPPVIELHVDSGELAHFLVGVTPMSKGEQDILVIVYPLFDEGSNYIPLDEAKPISHQNIKYKVLGETVFGITSGQLNSIKHLFGWGSLIASTISIANQYTQVSELLTQWKESIPWLVTIQVPFVYIYFIFSNRFITHIQAY